MKFDIQLLYGIYELARIQSSLNGHPLNESANSGMFVFTRDAKLSVVSGAHEWVMAYTGFYEVTDDNLLIRVKACVKRELEGKIIGRKILKLDGSELILGATSEDEAKTSEIAWRKIISL